MTKYSTELKITIVKEYWKGFISLNDLATKYSVSVTPVKNWVSKANKHGLESLVVTRKKQFYSLDFKLHVINYLQTNEVSRRQAAAHFGISSSQVNSWYRIFQSQGVAGLRPKPRGRPSNMTKSRARKAIKKLKPSDEEKYKEEIIKLKAQLYETEMERDILKVLAAMRKNQSKS